MLGYITYGDGPKKPALQRRGVAGGSFTELLMGQPAHPNGPFALRRARLAALMLRDAGVRTAVFPVDFPYTSLFIRMGVCPVDALPLRRALAPALTRRRLESLGVSPTQAVVAVSGERASNETAAAAKYLALSYRYVLLSTRSGGEEFAKNLRREFGVSLLLSPTIQQLDRADALLLFAPRRDLALNNPIFYTLFPGGEAGRGRLSLRIPDALSDSIEPNCDQEQLAAALYSQGVLPPEALLAEIPC